MGVRKERAVVFIQAQQRAFYVNLLPGRLSSGWGRTRLESNKVTYQFRACPVEMVLAHMVVPFAYESRINVGLFSVGIYRGSVKVL